MLNLSGRFDDPPLPPWPIFLPPLEHHFHHPPSPPLASKSDPPGALTLLTYRLRSRSRSYDKATPKFVQNMRWFSQDISTFCTSSNNLFDENSYLQFLLNYKELEATKGIFNTNRTSILNDLCSCAAYENTLSKIKFNLKPNNPVFTFKLDKNLKSLVLSLF